MSRICNTRDISNMCISFPLKTGCRRLHMEDVGLDESMSSKWILKIWYESVKWINLAQYRFSRGTQIHLVSSYNRIHQCFSATCMWWYMKCTHSSASYKIESYYCHRVVCVLVFVLLFFVINCKFNLCNMLKCACKFTGRNTTYKQNLRNAFRSNE